MERGLILLGGIGVGVAVSLATLSLTGGVYVDQPFLYALTAFISLAGGILLGRATAPKTQQVRLTGRVFEFPQGPVMLEVALRRAGSLIPAKVTRSE